jgi:NADH-quinone oxidoreductase subunit F
MLGRTFCPLGDAAAMPMIGFFKKFRDEFEEYIKANPAAPETQALVELVTA